jgi:transketolase
MMRAVYGSTVLYPCDANQTAILANQMAELPGISYLRTTRARTPVIYSPDERFPAGGSKVLRQSGQDQVTVVAAGITVHESLKAADQLQAEGIRLRVIDAYSVKPIDERTLRQAAAATGGRIVVVEDHWPEGGLGDAVLSAFAGKESVSLTLLKLGVQSMPGSGTPAELMHAAGIDADHIVAAVRSLLARRG